MRQGWRKLFVLVGVLAGATGFGLVVGYTLVTMPGREDPADVPIQSSPDWIWQLGLALGAVGWLVLWRVMVRSRDGEDRYLDVSDTTGKAGLGAAFPCMAGGLLVATACSPDSIYRHRPLWAAAFVVVGAVGYVIRA